MAQAADCKWARSGGLRLWQGTIAKLSALLGTCVCSDGGVSCRRLLRPTLHFQRFEQVCCSTHWKSRIGKGNR